MAEVVGWESVWAAMDTFMEYLEPAIGDVLLEVGEEAEVDIKNSIATPYPPASFRGEPPHLRTGNLHGGVDHSVSGLILTVSSQRPRGPIDVPRRLEYGLGRPYMGPARERLAQRARSGTFKLNLPPD